MDRSTLVEGPVAITGASGQVGRAVQQRLRARPNPVIPVGRDDDLTSAFADAQVVVHLAGGLRPRRPDTTTSSNLGTVEETVRALTGSAVERVVFLSFVTADMASPNPYLRSKAQAEQRLQASGVPTVVFRTGHVIGPPDAPGPTARSMVARRGRVTVLGDGRQRVAPIMLGDVVEAVVGAALDPTTPTGVHTLTGPDVMSLDDLVDALNGHGVRIRHLTDGMARALALVLPSLPRPLVDVMLQSALPSGDPQATARAFGLDLHHVRDAWQPTPRLVGDGP